MLLIPFFVMAMMGGIMALIIVYAIKQSKAADEAWRVVAAQHGLTLSSSRHMHGRKYGQAVSVGVVVRGSGKNKQSYTVVSARLDRPLDLGLHLRMHGFFNDMFHRSEDIQIGDPPFDAAFIVSADEEHRARAVLVPRLRALILQHLGHSSHTFSFGDHGLTIECRGVTSDGHWLGWALEVCARATHELDQARQQVPIATPLAHHASAWSHWAHANGLTGSNTPLGMWGQLGAAYLHVHSVRTDRLLYQLEVSLRFARTLGIGLDIQPTGLLDKVAVFFGGQDFQTGQAPFDAAFRVKLADLERGPELLDAPTCARILQLQAHAGPTLVSDEGLAVRLPQVPHDPAVVPRVVGHMTALAEDLGARAPGPHQGAYR